MAIPTHAGNGDLQTRRRNQPAGNLRLRTCRGFSILELGVASTVLLILASVISLAVARSAATSTITRAEADVVGMLDAALAKVASQPYSDLLGDTFTVPEACPGSTTGVSGTSCLDRGSRQVQATYSITLGVDPVGTSQQASSSLTVTAAAELRSGHTVVRERTVPAPTTGYAPGDGVVRVTLESDSGTPIDELVDGPVYLINEDTEAVITSSAVSAAGVALLRADAAGCTEDAPCRIGLSGSAPYHENDNVALEPAAVAGDAAAIVLGDGSITTVTARIAEQATLTIELVAENPSGYTGTPTQAGSVCLWANFHDGVDQRFVPMCNTDDPTQVELSSYTPDGAASSIAIPTNRQFAITVDHPYSVCPYVPGLVGHTTAGWLEAAVCTSFTWGSPSTIGPAGSPTTFVGGATIHLAAGEDATYELVWSGDVGRPAAGYGGEPVWAKPREAAGCVFDASCVSFGTDPDAPFTPEVEECPDSHCLSVANLTPQLTAPVVGSAQVHTVELTGSTTGFPVTIDDHDGDLFTATLTELPADGTLSIDGVPASAGMVLGGGATAGPVTYTFSYTRASTELRTFTLSLADGGAGSPGIVEVGMYVTNGAWQLTPTGATGAQATLDNPLGVAVVNTDGEIAAAGTVSFAAPLGAALTLSSTTATIDGAGNANITVDMVDGVNYPDGGSYTVTATSNTRTADIPVVVTSSAGTLDVVAFGAPQGSSGTSTVTATDLAGDPMAGVLVNLDVLQSGAATSGVYPRYAACVTTGSGSCAVDIVIESSAATGTYTVNASSGAFSDSSDIIVSATLTSLTADATTLSQSSSGPLTVTALDGAGDPVGGVEVTLNVGVGLTASAPATTSASGTVTFTVTASSTAASTTATASAASGTVTRQVTVTVTATPTNLTVGDLTVTAGATSTLIATVTSDGGQLVEGATVTFVAETGSPVKVTRSATTASTGQAPATVTVDADAVAGSYPVVVSVAGLTPAPIAIVVP